MNTKNIVYSGLIIAFGVCLPLFFHIFIPSLGLGPKLLPIHYSAYFAAGFFGPIIGAIVGFFTPIISFFITGMPLQLTFIYIAFETMTYGITFGLFYYKKNFNIYLSLVLAMILGKLVNFAGLFLLGNLLFNKMAPAFQVTNIIGSLTVGLLGNVLQLLIIPVVVKRVNIVFNFKKIEDKDELF
ncbi:MAG: putative rane protein [Haloplasmataceae bacterium]|nr:putative rane protein [Haloplasmataceae bacterium]